MNLREELQKIYDARGKLTPTVVLDEAQHPAHPLHDRFEWDDVEAAGRYRIAQAHRLITSVRITYRSENGYDESIRAFHAIASPDGHRYEPAEGVAQNDISSTILMRSMEREWVALKKRYERFAEFRELITRDLGAA